MKRFICALLLICMVFVACDMGNNGNDDDGFFSISNRNMGIKSLYISNISVNGNGRAASGSTIQTLSYINNLGQNMPFFFVSPSGKNIVLSVSEVQQLDDKRFLVDFDSFYEITAEGNVFTIGETIYTSGRALIDMKSGKVFDFNGYNNIQFVSNDLLFTIENQTLYKVDLNNISVAVSLNNPTYNPIYQLDPTLIFENKIIAFQENNRGEHFVFDINNMFPPQKMKYASLTSGICSFDIRNEYYIRDNILLFYKWGSSATSYNYDFVNGIVMVDLSGNPHFYTFYGFSRYVDGDGTKYFTCRLSIDDDGNILLSDSYEGDHTFSTNWETQNDYDGLSTIFLMNSAGIGKSGYLNSPYGQRILDDVIKSQSIILYSSNGFIHLKKKANGIQVESTALSMPKVDANSSFINKDNYLYYMEGSSIKRLYLASGETPEVVYTNSRLLTSGTSIDYLTASGSNLIFYQYANDNVSVNTYSLAMYQQGATPKLLATSSIDVRDIIELDF